MEFIKRNPSRTFTINPLISINAFHKEIIEQLQKYSIILQSLPCTPKIRKNTPVYSPGPKPSKLLLNYINSPKTVETSSHKITCKQRVKKKTISLPTLVRRKESNTNNFH